MPEIPITLEEYKSMNVNYTLALISITIIVFEYILTFQYEVERFWKPRVFNSSAIFFYINRYLTLLGHIPVMVEYFWTWSGERKMQICKRLQSYHQFLAILIQIIVASLLIMRTYALYEKSKRVLAIYLSISLTAVCIGCWAVGGSKESHKSLPVPVPIGCGATLSHESAVRLGAAWTSMLVFDVMVFSMTLYKSITLPGVRGIQLLTVLIRDGTLYFGVMVASNLANIMTFMIGGLFTRGVVTTFTNTMSSILIARLMLNLRDPDLVSSQEKLPTCTVAPVLTSVINTYITTECHDVTVERRDSDRCDERVEDRWTRRKSESHQQNHSHTDIEMIPRCSNTAS